MVCHTAKIKPDVHPRWFGYSFNPGLRRLKQYQEIGSAFVPIGHENEISIHFKSLGYYMSVLEHGAVRHLGRNERCVIPNIIAPLRALKNG